jgi:hypothetical protein
MDSLPLTRPGPWIEVPANAGMEPLFDDLAPLCARPVEVTVTIPHGQSRRTVMHLLVAEDDAPRALALAAGACRGVDGFEINARQFAGE